MRVGNLARTLLVAGAAVALTLVLVLLAVPDRTSVPRAAARTRHRYRPVLATRAPARRRPRAISIARSLPSVEITVSPRAVTTSVPGSFLGLSTEYWALPIFRRHVPVLERVLTLLHVPGNGPLLLRVGGDSADHTFWEPTAHDPPRWVFRLTPAWLRETSALVQRSGVRLILDLNLVTDSPSQAALWAQAAERELPAGSIVGFEIGNEPDLYVRKDWIATVSRADAELLPTVLDPTTYAADFRAYSQALAQVAPHVPLLGPVVANPRLSLDWISTLLAAPHPGLAAISAHRYPYSACATPGSHAYPTIARILSPYASVGVARSVAGAVTLAHDAGLPFRLTELNSVTCGGRPGISDSFATALWAPDVLFELLRAGVDGVNIHVRAQADNAPFAFTHHGLVARPLLYGMLLFARALGPNARSVALHVSASKPSLQLTAWGVRVRRDTLHVVLIDKSASAVRVRLRLPASGPATVQRLLAPSVSARSGVTLAGQQLSADGRWVGRRVIEAVAGGRRGYQLTLPAMSAALIGVQLGRGALAWRQAPVAAWRRAPQISSYSSSSASASRRHRRAWSPRLVTK
ncbi:MAG: glycosyl hydrolase family 79 C-terminal domain-containing protein [Solirubrobacteraceae bacterium]|jgi:hypothetical protein